VGLGVYATRRDDGSASTGRLKALKEGPDRPGEMGASPPIWAAPGLEESGAPGGWHPPRGRPVLDVLRRLHNPTFRTWW
jgi:hypothetical protein